MKWDGRHLATAGWGWEEYRITVNSSTIPVGIIAE